MFHLGRHKGAHVKGGSGSKGRGRQADGVRAEGSSVRRTDSETFTKVTDRQTDSETLGPAANRSNDVSTSVVGSVASKPKRITASTMVFGLVFLAGLCLLLYPMFSNAWNEWRHGQAVENYQQQVSETSQEDAKTWLSKAHAYNKTLTGKGIPDAFAFHKESENQEYLSQLAFNDDGMMGYLNIPKISQCLPICHTTSEESLEKGVGHLQGSALPVGGASTHSVLSAHRGLPSAALFTDLDQLQEGDKFFVHVLDQHMAYQVDQVLVVEPTQTESLGIQKGKDLVTLVTCTPYGVNTQRLLVQGHRVPYDPADEAAGDVSQSIFTQYWFWIAVGLGVVAMALLLVRLIAERRRSRR